MLLDTGMEWHNFPCVYPYTVITYSSQDGKADHIISKALFKSIVFIISIIEILGIPNTRKYSLLF